MNLVGKYAMPGSSAICQAGSAAQVAFDEDTEIRRKWSHGATTNRSVWKYWLAGDLHIKTELVLLEKAGN